MDLSFLPPVDSRVMVPVVAGLGGALLLWGADTEAQRALNSTSGKVLIPIVGGIAIAGAVYYFYSS